MGGNALSKPSRRIPKSEYVDLENYVIEKLQQTFSDVRRVKYYREKEDFGDMDILVAKNGMNNNQIKQYLFDTFPTNEVVCNTDTVSFELQEFQIDLMFAEPEDMESSEFYFSFNDISNLEGRIANKFGLKFGDLGLVFVNRGQSGNIMNRVTLTKDPRRIYDFLGFDYDRYLKGFDTLEEIFEFVLSGKYFSKEIFDYENLNHQNRTRNRKRKTYKLFVDYIQNIERYYSFKEKHEYIDDIDAYFPEVGLKAKLKLFEEQERVRNMIKDKFSGKLVMLMYPELQNAALGKFIEAYKDSKESFDEFVLNTDQEGIKGDLVSFHDAYFKK